MDWFSESGEIIGDAGPRLDGRSTTPSTSRRKKIRTEKDLDGDGRIDTWNYYDGAEKLVRKERDVKGSGKVDYWEYWEGGAIDRIGEDLDGDGAVDRWTKGPAQTTDSAKPAK